MSVNLCRYWLAALVGLCAALLGCSGMNSEAAASEMQAEPALASSEFLAVRFKSGHPSVGERFLDAVESPSEVQESRLKIDAGGLRTIPGVRVEIVGFTDDRECSGQECYELSLRRAKSVYDWFLSHGIQKENMKEPEGRGSEMAIQGNETEEGRRRNRRTEVNLINP
ncbi:MAG TPA: OmpA family protein [Lysobacter sp.]